MGFSSHINKVPFIKLKKDFSQKERNGTVMTEYLPEGELYRTSSNALHISSISALEDMQKKEIIAEAVCTLCDSNHNLIVDLGFTCAVIPRTEGAIGIEDGSTRDIALISRVNKPICFMVKDILKHENGKFSVVLSRKQAQEKCITNYISKLKCGDVINARVTHLESFGAFVDIGCGIPSLVPIDLISVSRISHPSDRFIVGQNIRAVVKSTDNDKITLSHKELLGTWKENADMYSPGETVTGIVRSVEEYGIFVELAPNLAGLAEVKQGVEAGNMVSVYIKAIIPEKMKIKLIIVDNFSSEKNKKPLPYKYFDDSSHIDSWTYSTESCPKNIRTDFI